MLFLLDGTVRVQQTSDSGHEIVLYRIHAGQSCVPTTAYLLAYQNYAAEGISETTVQAAAITRAVFDDLLASTKSFQDFVFAAFSKRITDLFLIIDEVAFQRMDVRLAHKLIEMSAGEQRDRVWDLRGLAVLGGMDSGVGIALLELGPHIDIFLAAFDDIPDPRADNARHDLCELLVVSFVAVFCGATSCAEMADFGRAKEHVFRDFLKLRQSIPSHDTFSTVFRMIDPKALDAAFGRVLAQIAVLLGDGDVIAIDGKALRGARDKGQSARTRMMVPAYAAGCA
jgi:CRP-like cAMP-binding protein